MYFLYAPFELLVALNAHQTVFIDTIIVNLATSIQIITRFLPWTSGPSYSAVLPVLDPNSITVLRHTGFAAFDLRIVGGFRNQKGED